MILFVSLTLSLFYSAFSLIAVINLSIFLNFNIIKYCHRSIEGVENKVIV